MIFTKKTIIGILATRRFNKDNLFECQSRFVDNFPKRVMEAGGLPIGLLFPDENFNEEEMKMCDGLIIQGGPHLGSSHICTLHNSVAREEIFENDDCVFKVTGISDDNVIEVAESKSDWWCVGVQFHPELETENLKLFEKLIEKV